MLDAHIDALNYEVGRTGPDDLKPLAGNNWTKPFVARVIDVKSTVTESADQVANQIRQVLEYVPADRLGLSTDCGLINLPRIIAAGKLRALADGAPGSVRAEIPGIAHAGSRHSTRSPRGPAGAAPEGTNDPPKSAPAGGRTGRSISISISISPKITAPGANFRASRPCCRAGQSKMMTEIMTSDESRSRAIGHREFTWFTPAAKHPTDFANLTVGQYSSPAEWLRVGWPVRFDDGRDPFTEDSTKVRSSRWRDWRDPFQVWQRPYVQNLTSRSRRSNTLALWCSIQD